MATRVITSANFKWRSPRHDQRNSRHQVQPTMGKGGVQIYRGYSKNIPGTLPSLLKKCLTDLRHRDSRSTVVGIVAEAGIGTVLPTTRHTCAVPGCDVTLLDHHAINHSSYHMLHTPSALGKAESCALCLGPASDCPSFLLKTTELQPGIVCATFSPGASE